jgi:ribosomal protein S18 acetylase RimI-like enzyme
MRGCPDLQDIFVCPDFRSRGIGTRLLTAAEHLARLRGYGRVGMGVDITNTRARALYDRRGYRDAGSGEYQIRWKYTDRNGEERWAEECCNYLIKDI